MYLRSCYDEAAVIKSYAWEISTGLSHGGLVAPLLHLLLIHGLVRTQPVGMCVVDGCVVRDDSRLIYIQCLYSALFRTKHALMRMQIIQYNASIVETTLNYN